MNQLIIVDDHPVVREGITRLLERESDIEVCGCAGTVGEARDLVGRLKPDLVLADLTLPDGSGIGLIKDLKVEHPDIPVLVISLHDEDLYAERVLRAGGRGYITKDAASNELVEAIQRVLRGEIYLSRKATQRLAESFSGHQKNASASPIGHLTDRELEVFQLIGAGKSTREVGVLLHISPRTVDAHRAHIKEKLGLEDGHQLVRLAVRWAESGE